MIAPRMPARDPRTVARDIPGIFDVIFPQLAPGVVVHFNRKASCCELVEAVPAGLIASTSLQHAMLFEVAVAAGEQLVLGANSIDMDAALGVAVRRQKRHFDAKIPEGLTEEDKSIVTLVANNLATMLSAERGGGGSAIVCSPRIPGFQWIASGVGDFALGSRLIEIKCTNKPFSSSDFRQIMMYWLLSYASSVEGGAPEWTDALLVNPRLNTILEVSFDEVIHVIGAGRSKVDLLQLFSSMVGESSARMLQAV